MPSRLIVLFALVLIASVRPASAHVTFTANLDTAQAGNAGSGTGTMTLDYEPETGDIIYEIAVQNLTGAPLAAHLHLGAPGVAGGIVVGLPGGGIPAGADGSASGAMVLPPESVDDLYAGRLYVNVHTAAFLAGEIRGQVLVDAGSCSCQTAKNSGKFKSCVKKAIKGLSKDERKESEIAALKKFAPKASCGKKKAPKKAIACCLPNVPEGNIVTGQLCASVSAAKCEKLQGQSAGDGLSCVPSNPCPVPAD